MTQVWDSITNALITVAEIISLFEYLFFSMSSVVIMASSGKSHLPFCLNITVLHNDCTVS